MESLISDSYHWWIFTSFVKKIIIPTYIYNDFEEKKKIIFGEKGEEEQKVLNMVEIKFKNKKGNSC